MTCCGVPTIETLPKAASISAVAKENDLLAASQKLDGKQIQTDFSVPQMHCIACIRSLENSVGSLSFVERVRANLSLKKISVVWNQEEGNALAIDQAITDAGFDHSAFDLNGDDNEQTNRSTKLLIALAVAGFAAVNIMLLSISVWSGADAETTRLFHLISGIIAVPAVMFSGQPFFRSALTALKVGRLNMDVPISLAVLLALGMSIYESLTGGNEAYFDAAVTLLFFLLIGRYLDNLMRDKARSAVVQLSRLATKGAMIVSADATLRYLELDNIKPGMIVRVMAGDHIPVDGEIIKGSSDVDRSLVTGESLPHPVKKGIAVEAGILNLTGTIDILVKRDARHSFLGEVQRMMEAAEQGRGHYTRIADRMARIYAPAVHILALLAFAGWMIATGGDWHLSLYVAISVLIITCPCALGLAVPVVHVVAARRLFKQGIIIRDGSGFERLEEVDHIIFDKTGTLTSGVPQLSLSAKFNEFAQSNDATIARSLASHSNHPFSKALSGFLNVPITGDIVDIKEIPGSGVEACIMGQLARLGQNQWVRQIAIPGSGNASDISGLSFALENGEVVTFEHSEQLRRGGIPTIAELNRQGFEIEILSGDSRKSVKTIADRLAIGKTSYDQRPADKVSRINELKKRGKKVLMVGDGLNDSPALAAAHVSIAPANASDIARYAADFVFTRESLTSVPFAMHIAKRSGNLVRQNFSLAILYNAIAIPFALAGYVTPLIAAIAMSASSIVVVANSMRLNLDNKAQVKLGSRLQLDDGFKIQEKSDDPLTMNADSGRHFA